MTMRRLTSAYLMRRVWPLRAGDIVLLHAAAAVSGSSCRSGRSCSASRSSARCRPRRRPRIARAALDHVINSAARTSRTVRELTNGVGATVVYDSVGKDTFAASLDSLNGAASSCAWTPSGRCRRRCDAARDQGLGLRHAAGARRLHRGPGGEERARRRALRARRGRPIKIEINQRYELKDAARASDLEARMTTGSSIFAI